MTGFSILITRYWTYDRLRFCRIYASYVQEEAVSVEGVDARLALELGGLIMQQTRCCTLPVDLVQEHPVLIDMDRVIHVL